MMNHEDFEEIVESGERLPVSMFDASLLTDEDDLKLPVFSGEKVVDPVEE